MNAKKQQEYTLFREDQLLLVKYWTVGERQIGKRELVGVYSLCCTSRFLAS